jgi:hypothetical protein
MGRREEVITLSARITAIRKELSRLEKQLDELLGNVTEPSTALMAFVPEPVAEMGSVLDAVVVRSGRFYGGGEATPEPSLAKRIVELLDRHREFKFSPSQVARRLHLPTSADGSVRATLHRLREERRVAYHARGEFCSIHHRCPATDRPEEVARRG